MTAEEWRPIAGIPDYEISDQGRVRSYQRRQPRILSPAVHTNGYFRIHLFLPGGQRATRYIHDLVARAFHGPRPDGQEVRHLNGQPLDNRAENLLWGTKSENQMDLVRHGRHRQVLKTACPRGHEYTADNVYVLPSRPTARYCRACHRDHSREYQRLHYARRRALAT